MLFDFINLVKNLIGGLGYFGVFAGTFLEAVFPPIPSELVMGFSGFLIADGKFDWIPVIVFALLGNILSVSLIYFIGKKYGKNFLIKYGRYVGVSEKEMNFGENLFKKHGYKIVLGCQVLPLARTTIAFPAGVLGLNYKKYIFFNTLGASVWLTVLTYIGFKLGENWLQITDKLKSFEDVGMIALVTLAIYLGYKWIKNVIKIRKENLN